MLAKIFTKIASLLRMFQNSIQDHEVFIRLIVLFLVEIKSLRDAFQK